MYQPYHHRPRARGSYFFPFFALILVGLIVVLIFQIVAYFQTKRLKALENKAAVHVVTGKAEMKIWGVSQWTGAFDESLLHEGDAIRTAPGSRVILTFLNGSVIRLNSETEIEITDLKSRDGEDEAALKLLRGEIWLKHTEKDTVRAAFTIVTDHLDVHSLGTIFAVSNRKKQEVRVLEGKVEVAINVAESEGEVSQTRKAETLEVAMGQEVSVDRDELARLKNRQPVNLLALLSDEFRNSEWYTWNRREDASAGSGISVAEAVKQKEVSQIVEPALVLVVGTSSPNDITGPLAPPVLLDPQEPRKIIRSGSFVLKGTVSPFTEKIEVTSYTKGKAEPYLLKKYKARSLHWSYAVSTEYGNLIPGENRFTIMAIRRDGKRSEPLEVTLLYERPKEPSDLSPPELITLNGEKILSGTEYETSEEVVEMVGTVGKGIVKVVVNDFPLTRYIPESLEWRYFAKTAYGNLKEGKNEYQVYGVDFDGKRTPVLKFTIVKKASNAPL